jgi:ribosomal-protein-alanine N-acetyltransferase
MTQEAIVEAGHPHVPVLAVLHGACFPEKPWGEAALAETLRMPGAFAFLALDASEQPVGFIIGWAKAGSAEIVSLGVLPESRRRGTGRALVGAAASRAEAGGATEFFLEVAEANFSALALYRESGFEEVGCRQGYYGPGSAALVMKRRF